VAELVYDVRAQLGEGPIWDERRQRLLFADILRGHVHAFDPVAGKARVYEVGQPVGAIACAERGDWVLAAGRGFVRLDPDTGRVTLLAEAAAPSANVRMNDGYVDPAGRFWAGTMSLVHEAGQGTLYRLDADGSVHVMITPVTTSNGIDWSPDGKLMYYIDTRTSRVDVFDFDVSTGAVAGRRVFVEIRASDGHPDGLVVDHAGGIWVAFWRGGAVRRYAPDGHLERTVSIPASLATKCAFGGAALDELYVTTAWIDLTADERRAQPQAGGLFRVKPGVKGRAPSRYAG